MVKKPFLEYILERFPWLQERELLVSDPAIKGLELLYELSDRTRAYVERAARKRDPGMTTYPAPSTAAVWMACLQNQRIFKIGRAFGEALNETDLKISPRYLQLDGLPMCIEFPDDISFRFDAGGIARSAFVTLIESAQHTDRITRKKSQSPYLLATMPVYDEAGNIDPMLPVETLSLPLNHTTIEECVASTQLAAQTPITAGLVSFIAKCVLYIQSGDPDLRKYRAPRSRKENAKALAKFREQNAETSLLDMILVGFDFKKPRIYGKEEVSVRTHLRWQPYGPGRSRVRLKWIYEHVRRYGSGQKEGNETNPPGTAAD